MPVLARSSYCVLERIGCVGVAMSLVGSLEDLSLGDIMQIISLSQKSGVLVLDSGRGSGRIVFCGGLVQAACLKGVAGHGQDLRALVLDQGILDPAGFDALSARAAGLGIGTEEALSREVGLDAEKLDALVQDSVEAAVLEMFSWPDGDFSFDVRTESDPDDPQMILMKGINAQYLAMEGMRVKDEAQRVGASAAGRDEPDPILADDVSAEAMFGVEALDVLSPPDSTAEAEARDRREPVAEADPDNEQTATHVVVAKVLEGDGVHDEGAPHEASVPLDSGIHYRRPLVVIDPDVAVLEWVKTALQAEFDHVHVFQRAEQGLNRIRQYLIRGTLPVVLLSTESEIDPLSGIHGMTDYVKRLKTQAAKLPILALVEAGREANAAGIVQAGLLGILSRPAALMLRDDVARAEDAPARVLSEALASALQR